MDHVVQSNDDCNVKLGETSQASGLQETEIWVPC